MLSVSHLHHRFGSVVALDDVSLDIPAGECLGLLGPNGAGKSTLMSFIAGLRSPDRGTITVDGKPVSPTEVATRTALGLAPQNIALYLDLSAEQNLRIFGELYGLRGATLRGRVAEALAAVQLADRRRDLVKTFSGGMQRRLNLAAALLQRPKLLLCDEPTVGVDPQSRNAIFEYLEQLNREGLTIVYSTHYMEEAERLCSRIGIIDHGQILALGTLDELLTRLPFEEEIEFPRRDGMDAFAAELAPLGEVQRSNAGYRFRPRGEMKLSSFYAATERHGLAGRLFTVERPTLEAVFLHLTGRKLRE